MRSFTTSELPGRCKRCWVMEAFCICAELPTVLPRTEVVIVRHQREGWKSTGTARVASLAMPTARCLEYGEDGEPARAELAGLTDGAAVLFPAPPYASWDGPPPTRLVVLDGTWRQTRRMFHRLPALHALPRLALPPKEEAVLRLRQSTLAEGRSTLEAIADALALLEGEAVARPLWTLHERFVEQVLRARGVWHQRRDEA